MLRQMPHSTLGEGIIKINNCNSLLDNIIKQWTQNQRWIQKNQYLTSMSSQEGLPEDGISADLKNEQNAAKQMQKTFQTENSRWKVPEITKFRVKQFGKARAQHRGCGWKAGRQIRYWRALSLWHRGRTSSCKQGAMEEGVCHELV